MITRQRPIFSIEGTDFYVDIDKQALVQIADPTKEISFIDHMQLNGDQYLLKYDRKERSYRDLLSDLDQVLEVDIPQLCVLDPEGMAEKFGYTTEQLKGKSDLEVMNDLEALELRQRGALPTISICGEAFIIDLKLHQLRHAEDFFPQIELKRMDVNEARGTYLGFYHPLLRQMLDLDPNMTQLPDGAVLIEIPNELRLDPVGAARLYGMDEQDVLRRYPIQKNLTAIITPLAETGLPKIVEHNQALKAHEETTKQVRPRHRMKI